MADLRDNLWPEGGSHFADLEDAFNESGMAGGVVRVRQEDNESRAAFDLRLAALEAQHPADTLFVCMVREWRDQTSPLAP